MGKFKGDSDRWIWPFELLDKLGEGAMGVVYRARSVTNNRHVALKLLPAEFNNDPTLAARFEREMEVLKTLRHPHIVHCFGGTSEGKRRYYAMELVEGGSLYHLIQRHGSLTWPQMVEYGLQMCAGLGYAHQKGIVHRDIKPSNFLLTKDGRLKLSDFGLAHVGTATKLTAAGKTMGTYQYMAPEQIRGKDTICAQTDLYALGCVFFEMLTGKTPFNGETPAQILQQHLEAPPPRVSDSVRDCPDPAMADALINSLMGKSIDNRPSSAEEVADWLLKSQNGSTPSAKTKRRSKPVHFTPSTAETKAVLPALQPALRRLRLHQGTLLWISGVLVVLMLIWNVSLQSRKSTRPVASNGLTTAEELWVEAFQTGDDSIKTAAARALGKIGKEHQQHEILTLLISGLEERHSSGVRTACAKALGEMGEHGKPAITQLLKLSRDDPLPIIRKAAEEAMIQIRGEEPRPKL